MKRIIVFVALCVMCTLLFGCSTVPSSSEKTPNTSNQQIEVPVQVTYLGHSAVKLESGGKTILIDPWIKDNPKCTTKLEDIKKADIILVTHDHFDHIGDTVALAKVTNATVVAMPETTTKLMKEGGLPADQVVFGMGMNIGNETKIKDIGIIMTEAFHSSESGAPVGYIIEFPGGATVYHAGDTGIFSNMKTLAELYPIDLALLPIGGAFTMDANQAAKSLNMLKPTTVIPIHYATFPILAQNADEFVELAKEEAPQVKVEAIQPGGTYTLQ